VKHDIVSNSSDHRCCHVCHPDRFTIEDISVNKQPGLTRGRKRVFPPGLADSIRLKLQNWRDDILFPMHNPSGSYIMTAEVLFGDEVIDRIISCGKRLENAHDLERNIRWYLAFDEDGQLSRYGQALLAKLAEIYSEYDQDQQRDNSSSESELEPTTSTTSAHPIAPELAPDTADASPAAAPTMDTVDSERFYAHSRGRLTAGRRGRAAPRTRGASGSHGGTPTRARSRPRRPRGRPRRG